MKDNKNLDLFSEKDFPEKKMSVKEVSISLNVSERTIQRHLKDITKYSDNVVGHGKKSFMNESEVTEIKMRIEKSGRNDIISSSDLPKTNLEKKLLIKQGYDLLMEEVIDLQEENKQLKIEKMENKPKVELANTALRDKTKQYSIRDAGKHLGLSQKDIFKIMRANRLLTSKDIPSQKSLSLKLLTLKTNVIDGKNRPQSVMTMENMDNFRKRYMK